MHQYETLFIIHPEAPEAARKELVDRLRRLIETMGGRQLSTDEWGMRDLAYVVRKQARGFYVRFEYTAKADVVRELERTMKLADEVLRFVSVRLPKTRKAAASAPSAGAGPAAGAEASHAE
jgi:small subunit ribosomal protein S6